MFFFSYYLSVFSLVGKAFYSYHVLFILKLPTYLIILFHSLLQITYSLTASGGDGSEFTINAQTGAIVTTKPLDRETLSGYLLTVTAKDGGVPALSDTTDVEISVTDVNDNAPQFNKASYSGSISEDALVGTSVLQVSLSQSKQANQTITK